MKDGCEAKGGSHEGDLDVCARSDAREGNHCDCAGHAQGPGCEGSVLKRDHANGARFDFAKPPQRDHLPR